MAEIAVGSLVQTLGSLLVKEGLLTWGLHKDIDEIKLVLQSIQSFLKDADMRQHTQEGLKTWVGQVRMMAYEAEDIIDKYTYLMAKYHKQGLLGAIYSTISIPKKIFYQHRMAEKLQDFKSKLKTIEQNRIRYALPSCRETSNEAWEEYRMVADYHPEDDLVGIESNKGLLISWLTNKEPKRMAYSVVGMGGLGKTTLVGKAYHSSDVQNHFDCCAWVTVRQSFDTKRILQDMIKEFMGSSRLNDCSGKDCRDLVKILINHLELKRYVVILDDIWSIDAWNIIDVAVPKNRMGSRILITTRDEEVAFCVAEVESRVFHLQCLCENEAWNLFCQRAFKNTLDGACPDELRSLARNIVNKCDGLPLAIVTTGSLMASKKNVEAWRNLEASFGWVLSNNRFFEKEKNVLLLSYYELPIHLKQCFLHLCAFSEDYIFRDYCISRIWVAEGFIEKYGRLTHEDTAMNYINELVRRCMIQYVGQDCTLKNYRVHDVMREIGVSIAEDENFVINISNESEEPQGNRNARHLFRQIDSETDVLSFGTSNLRSYIVHGYGKVIKSFNPRFKLLRVLHLDGAILQEVPNSLGELFNLQYLCLRGFKIRELPNSLKRLCNLRTLDIGNSKVKKLPCWIVKFKKLRHLNMSYEGTFGVEAPTSICTLKSLEDLQFVEGNKELLKKMGNLTQLKWLGIERVKAGDGADLCASLERMESLLELLINQYREQGPLELDVLSSPPPLLQVLILNGKLERLPHWIVSVKNLRHLALKNSNLSADPLSPLQDLPNLEFLDLRGTYDGNQLCFRTPFFLKLHKLILEQFKNLDMVEIKDGAMCHLQEMYIVRCQELKTLPVGIEHLRQLKLLSVYGMLEEFTNRLGPGTTEEDRSKIQHIEVIKCY